MDSDAETLLVDRAGVPHVVTKNVLGQAGVYRPVRALSAPGPTPLKRVGQVSISATETRGGPVGSTGSLLVTGGAVSAEGTVVVLRTYTDAYLYPAADGDIVAALRRAPVRVALPNEPQGEAVALEPDGTLLSAGEGVGERIGAVQRAVDLVRPEPEKTTSGTEGARRAAARPGLPTLPALGIAVVVAAALVFGLSRLRRRN